jgi:hypothetical protein
MRAPDQDRSTSFKDVITDLLQQHPECGESRREFWVRLRDDPERRIDEVWRRLVNKQPELKDDDRTIFIKCLTEMWVVIECARYDAAENELRHLTSVCEHRLKKYWAKRFVNASHHELPAILKEMEQFSGERESEPTKLSDLFPELDIRSDHGGSRRRTAFMRFVSQMMHGLTGDWCDGEVATLTDIAFPQDESTSEDAVRSARRSMRSGVLGFGLKTSTPS